jgi:thiol-disulfide isomerase/thioredoxin
MRKLLSLIACGLLAAACTTTPSYHIIGSAPEELNGQILYLRTLDDNAEFNTKLDSITVNEGKFEFKGVVEQPQLAVIQTNDRKLPQMFLVLEKGNIHITLGEDASLSGTQANDSLQLYYSFAENNTKAQNEIRQKYQDAQADQSLTEELAKSLLSQYDSLNTLSQRFDSVFVTNNTNNLAGLWVLSRSIYNMTAAEIEAFLANATPAFDNSPLMQKVKDTLAAMKRGEVGAQYTNITMPSLDGQTISLSDYVGKDKYVLIDFWASWCGPCRRSMPYLVEAYKKYADKGFEIVGISFDDNKEAWQQGVEELGITWPQMSDLKGWKCEAGKVYGIRYIPQTLLIDKEGVIVEKNVEGADLEEVLQKYLGE